MVDSILILGGGKYYLKTILAIRRAGFRAVVMDRDPHAPGLREADVAVPIDFSNFSATLGVAVEHRITGVLPLNDFGVPVAAYVADILGLPGIDPSISDQVTQKYSMRKAWTAAGVPCPPFELVMNQEEYLVALERIGYPCILKPAIEIGGGSRGVVVLESKSLCLDAYKFCRRFSGNGGAVLIEGFYEGDTEHSAEVLVHNGKSQVLAIGDKIKTPLPYRVDINVLYPTKLVPSMIGSVKSAISKAVAGLGIKFGAVHIEFATSGNHVMFFEASARPGGGGTPEPIVSYVTGLDILGEIARLYTGQYTNPPEPKRLRGCNYHFLAPSPGVVAGVDGLEAARETEGILDADVFKKPGDKIELVKIGSDRAGYIIAGAESQKSAHELGCEVESMIRFRYRS